MNEDDLLELIEKAMSRELSVDEEERLQAYIDANPDACSLHRRMVATGDVLRRVPDIKAPASLKQGIMDSIDARRYPLKERAELGPSLWERILRPRMRLVYAFAVGVLVGVVVYSQLISDRPVTGSSDTGYLYGLIAGRGAGVFREADAVSVDVPGVQGEIRLMRAAVLAVVEQQLRSEEPLEIMLTYDPAAVRFEGFGVPMAPEFGVASGEGWVRVVGAGSNTYVMALLRPEALPTDLRIEVKVSGEAVYGAEFSVDQL